MTSEAHGPWKRLQDNEHMPTCRATLAVTRTPHTQGTHHSETDSPESCHFVSTTTYQLLLRCQPSTAFAFFVRFRDGTSSTANGGTRH
uniref:Uncharacterized protein n=1 Tax=Arundo donax TaxID=35708 RepID=A0A0A9GI21_ARUDO